MGVVVEGGGKGDEENGGEGKEEGFVHLSHIFEV